MSFLDGAGIFNVAFSVVSIASLSPSFYRETNRLEWKPTGKPISGRIKQTIANGKVSESKCSLGVMSVQLTLEHQDWGNLPIFIKC